MKRFFNWSMIILTVVCMLGLISMLYPTVQVAGFLWCLSCFLWILAHRGLELRLEDKQEYIEELQEKYGASKASVDMRQYDVGHWKELYFNAAARNQQQLDEIRELKASNLNLLEENVRLHNEAQEQAAEILKQEKVYERLLSDINHNIDTKFQEIQETLSFQEKKKK